MTVEYVGLAVAISTLVLALVVNLAVVSRWSSRLATLVENNSKEITLLREISTKQERRISFIEGALSTVLRDIQARGEE